MLTFHEERVRDCWEELYPLAYDHHGSSQNYKRHEPFNPRRERYEQYNDAGLFRLLTARDQGRLVGYFGVYLMESMHSQLPIAREDTFYLAPSHRGGRNALRFLRYVEAFISRSAPIEILFSCEDDNDSGIKGLLEYLDYRSVIHVYSKHLSTRADSAEPSVMEAAHVGTQ
jgi:hypothetical protein